MGFEPGNLASGEKDCGNSGTYAARQTADCDRNRDNGKPFSLQYNDLARWLFITLAFAGIVSTGFYGIPLIPNYLTDKHVDILDGIFTLFSALGTVWGVMAYREFTRSANAVIDARDTARKLDSMIGDYEYKSYNPVTKVYEEGFVPFGPIDFWDKETLTPDWMDKGKYWHILLGLSGDKEMMLKVVRDRDLPFMTGRRNVAVTERQKVTEDVETGRRHRKRYRYVVKIPQWLVMNTERSRLVQTASISDGELSSAISELNRKIVAATSEVIERERPRVHYPWGITALGVYLNKSLPIRIIYGEVIKQFPGAKKRALEDTSANLANVGDDDLISAIIEVAAKKGIPESSIEKVRSLIRFLKNAYTKQGLGEGASEYHSFHHSLEVSYMALHMLPREFHGYTYTPKDHELILVAGLLHDYDPEQTVASSLSMEQVNPASEEKGQARQPMGPKVTRTVEELRRTRIIDAYFTMNNEEFENYFRDIRSILLPPEEFVTTHPEYVKTDWSPTESMIVEALIWRTDFPFLKQKTAQKEFARLISQLVGSGVDPDRTTLLAEVLWLADLAVTYMGSDPIRAWDRVSNLYDELYLPRFEAVSRTDAFFADFAETPLFKEIMSTNQFPDVFRQRWNMIYQFFHEGNPSTQINRTIIKARKMYLRVNVEIDMRSGDLLYALAADKWAEYFIGVGKDQNEVMEAKSKFSDLDPQNASAFWGDIRKLLPGITERSVNNFLMVLPQHILSIKEVENKASFHALLSTLARKLARGGTLQILTDIQQDSADMKELLQIANQAGFHTADPENTKTYFPPSRGNGEFGMSKDAHVVVLKLSRGKL